MKPVRGRVERNVSGRLVLRLRHFTKSDGSSGICSTRESGPPRRQRPCCGAADAQPAAPLGAELAGQRALLGVNQGGLHPVFGKQINCNNQRAQGEPCRKFLLRHSALAHRHHTDCSRSAHRFADDGHLCQHQRGNASSAHIWHECGE